MSLKILVEIDTERDDAVTVGEVLRGKFWDQSTGMLGCYSTFTYNKDVTVLPDRVEKYPEDPNYGSQDITWHRAEWNGVVCEWYWDGDGTVRFILPAEGLALINSDCKKPSYWEWE